MNKRNLALVGIPLALVLFFAVNVFANATLRSARVDLTEEKLFSLSDGSRAIAENLEEPVRLYLYFSRKEASELTELVAYADRVERLLREYVRHSDGMLELEVIDPEAYSEAEDRARGEGIAPVPISQGSMAYFGIVGTNSTDDRETIPFLGAGDRERFLEYDVSRLIYRLAHPDRETVAVLSGLPIEGMPQQNPMNPQPSQRWAILGQMEQFYDVRTLSGELDAIEDDVDVLVLIHPRDLSETTLYAIDQFVMGGGRLIAFTDPHCDADQSGVNPADPMSQFQANRSSDLNRLYQAWGFEMVPNKVAGDREYCANVSFGGQRGESGPYVAWLQLPQEAFNEADPITSLLESTLLPSAGILRTTDGATTTFEPLLQTSEDSMELDSGRLQFMPDPKGLLASFVPGYERLTVAARISGEAASAFPEGKPGAATPEAPEGTEIDGAEEETPDDAEADETHLAASSGPIQVIAIADADLLVDRWWIQEQRLGGMLLGSRKISDNGDMLLNALENMLGGEELISIRARGRLSRPFDRVDEIQREAEKRFLAEREELERSLQQTEQEINTILRDSTADDIDALGPEIMAKIDQAEADKREINKKLRDVNFNLLRDVERLGTKLKWINVLAIPALVTAAALALGFVRVQRRGSK